MDNNRLRPISCALVLLTLFACNSENKTAANIIQTDDAAKSTSVISLENTDSSLGKRYFIQCQACHALAADADDLIGPNLWGIVGRPAGKQDGFQYSAGLAEADFAWSLETLNLYLTKPNDLIAGTSMIFAGIPDEQMRRDLLAYLVEKTTEK